MCFSGCLNYLNLCFSGCPNYLNLCFSGCPNYLNDLFSSVQETKQVSYTRIRTRDSKIKRLLKVILSVFSVLIAIQKLVFHEVHPADCESYLCRVKGYAFEIECNSIDAKITAIEVMEWENCTNECNTSKTCERQYLILKAHRLFCVNREGMKIIEHKIHFYEKFCTTPDMYRPGCEILGPSSSADTPFPNKGIVFTTLLVGLVFTVLF